MKEHTSIPESPWWVVDGDDKRRARLNTINHLVSLVPYDEVEYSAIELPPIVRDHGYQRPPMDNLNPVPEKY
jgi:hypothetical protein